MNDNLINQFNLQVSVTYRGECYLVRDNGAIYRKSRPGKRKRKLDEIWTFGNPSNSRGYMTFALETVHRIVATAFHGEQPSEMHIVDHIDTNRRNNRADNLRWITRLDNILKNPITLRRIESLYGSIDNFFKNPSKPMRASLPNAFDWMRTVSKEEAEASRDRITKWAASGKQPHGKRLGEWVFVPTENHNLEEEPVKQSQTPLAIQRNWKTPSEFPLCPNQLGINPLSDYLDNLKYGRMFSRNKFSVSTIHLADLCDDAPSLSVICNMGKEAFKDWAVVRVTVEDGKFCHENNGSFFSIEGATKQHYENLGRNWEGIIGDCIDDYC